jgi:hypothetical protein
MEVAAFHTVTRAAAAEDLAVCDDAAVDIDLARREHRVLLKP